MTQEQNEAICQMREKAAIWLSKMQACYFFEERLGKNTNIQLILDLV